MKTKAPPGIPAVVSGLAIALAPLALPGKPKVEVRVNVSEGIGKIRPEDSLSRTGSSYEDQLDTPSEFYLNVIVFSDNADAVPRTTDNGASKANICCTA